VRLDEPRRRRQCTARVGVLAPLVPPGSAFVAGVAPSKFVLVFRPVNCIPLYRTVSVEPERPRRGSEASFGRIDYTLSTACASSVRVRTLRYGVHRARQQGIRRPLRAPATDSRWRQGAVRATVDRLSSGLALGGSVELPCAPRGHWSSWLPDCRLFGPGRGLFADSVVTVRPRCIDSSIRHCPGGVTEHLLVAGSSLRSSLPSVLPRVHRRLAIQSTTSVSTHSIVWLAFFNGCLHVLSFGHCAHYSIHLPVFVDCVL
jgi:hypothetical protein